jgi:hypothetical protein
VVYSGGRNAGNPTLGAQWYTVEGGMQETPWSTVIYSGERNAGNPLKHSGI